MKKGRIKFKTLGLLLIVFVNVAVLASIPFLLASLSTNDKGELFNSSNTSNDDIKLSSGKYYEIEKTDVTDHYSFNASIMPFSDFYSTYSVDTNSILIANGNSIKSGQVIGSLQNINVTSKYEGFIVSIDAADASTSYVKIYNYNRFEAVIHVSPSDFDTNDFTNLLSPELCLYQSEKVTVSYYSTDYSSLENGDYVSVCFICDENSYFVNAQTDACLTSIKNVYDSVLVLPASLFQSGAGSYAVMYHQKSDGNYESLVVHCVLVSGANAIVEGDGLASGMVLYAQ
jgi:hypothetical protein